ncbi:MAG: nickel pincer cofactor biosynthesis protein LarC [Verrucomicrobiota bacterium]
MKTLYLDIFSGISGDMFMGAMIDLGADLRQIEQELAKLSLGGFHLHAHRAKRGQIEGVQFEVHLGSEPAPEAGHPHAHEHPPQPGRQYAEIKELISAAALSPWVKQKALAVFQRVADAEGKIHGLPPAEVHFHEVGAVDSIIDIVGGCAALDLLGRPRVLAAEAVEGTGWIDCAHGRFPIPAPATLEILAARRIPLTQCAEPQELITPTGAALLAEFAAEFGPMRGLAAEKIGVGAGSRENKTRPNVLRAILGESAGAGAQDWESDTIAVLETNLDDSSPEILGAFMEAALAGGAVDVFHAPVQMKKNRPGVCLTLLCAAGEADKFSEMILRHTSAFGVRRRLAERRKLRREFRIVRTPHGDVTVKLGFLDGAVAQVAPEFESCKKLAAEKNLPLAEIYRAVLAAWKP